MPPKTFFPTGLHQSVCEINPLTTKNGADKPIKDYILSVVKNGKPETVDQLVIIVQQQYPTMEREIINLIMQLQTEGKIHFTEKETTLPTSNEFIYSSEAAWFWITIALAMATVISVFTIPEDALPIVYVRYVLGSIFILWLPGYTLMKALFPSKQLDAIERVALSIGLSIALVPIVGLLLNYTPWGIRLAPITLQPTRTDRGLRNSRTRPRAREQTRSITTTNVVLSAILSSPFCLTASVHVSEFIKKPAHLCKGQYPINCLPQIQKWFLKLQVLIARR